MWVKVTFTNIHKTGNACARSFGRYINDRINDTQLKKNGKKN